MYLTFWGAARQVTGSMYLLELNDGYKILIDCGIDFSKDHYKAATSEFPFNPAEIDIVLLTHAHLDHCGNIPNLIKQGYRGQVLCTAPTYHLANLLLSDYAEISKEKYAAAVKHSRRPDFIDTKNNASVDDTIESLERFLTIGFLHPFIIRDNVSITFYEAGHLLGAAGIYIEVTEDGIKKTIGFSGDRGRKNYPLLKDPVALPSVDYLICETTYGSRSHLSEFIPEDEIAEVIHTACLERAGRLIIPAFSIGRTQTLLYVLNKLYKAGVLQKIKVFADSPMAEKATQLYQKYNSFLNDEAKEVVNNEGDLFDFENLIRIDTYKDSRALSNYSEPCIIISSSGMITGGRMQHHIKKNINNPYCTILVIGYSAEGTPGYQLTNGSKYIRLKGRDIPISAKVVVTDVFSGHADREDLLEFIQTQKAEQLKKIFLVHGEYESMMEFKKLLNDRDYYHVETPAKGMKYQL